MTDTAYTAPRRKPSELDILFWNFPNMGMQTGQWNYYWAGECRLERFDPELGVMVKWDGYIPPQPAIDDIIGMDNPDG